SLPSEAFLDPTRWLDRFGRESGGWVSQDRYPRSVADADGDGLADVVGFGYYGVYVSTSTSHSFRSPSRWTTMFTISRGNWKSQDRYPRLLADVNGDGKADIVGFGYYGVYVSLSTGHSFTTPKRWIKQFCISRGNWKSQDLYPRLLADVNGDGKADIVGFGYYGVYVSLFTGHSFTTPKRWIKQFCISRGNWKSQNLYPRLLADVNGDGKADIVGFGYYGVYVSLSTGYSFTTPQRWTKEFSPVSGIWQSQDQTPRFVADVNGDLQADLVGFAQDQVYVALSQGSSFANHKSALQDAFCPSSGWTSMDAFPRTLGDVDGDQQADIVGFASDGTYVSLADW
ncbi:MAG: VCBS repeat-containing protein, partial [Anaerolineae bacterium]|nr:VCBS repeat-containing protein [Anaerolineae bacterium]